MNYEIVINGQFDDAVTFRLKLFTAGLVCAKYNLDLFENKFDMWFIKYVFPVPAEP